MPRNLKSTDAIFALGVILTLSGVAVWSVAAALTIGGLMLTAGAILWHVGGGDA